MNVVVAVVVVIYFTFILNMDIKMNMNRVHGRRERKKNTTVLISVVISPLPPQVKFPHQKQTASKMNKKIE